RPEGVARGFRPPAAKVPTVILAATANGQRGVGNHANHADPWALHHEVAAAPFGDALGALAVRDSSRLPLEVSIQAVVGGEACNLPSDRLDSVGAEIVNKVNALKVGQPNYRHRIFGCGDIVRSRRD